MRSRTLTSRGLIALSLAVTGAALAEPPGESASPAPAASSPATAALDADEIFRRMDAALTSAEDQFFEYDFIVRKPGEAERRMLFQVTIKGDQKRLLHFLAPGDVKGMKFLILGLSQMYVYLPAYRKVRRVASNVRDQGFMGSAHSQDDMSIVTFSPYLKPRLLSEDAAAWTVEGTLREGLSFPYAKVVLTIDKKMYQPLKLLYFNDRGQHVKTEERVDWVCKDGNICAPGSMTLVDHRRNDVATILRPRKWKYNQGVSDRFFTVRNLQRRR